MTGNEGRPLGLLALIALGIVVGLLSLFATVQVGRDRQLAEREDVQRNGTILMRVESQTEHLERLSREQKQDLYELCEKAVQIAEAAGIATEPCAQP